MRSGILLICSMALLLLASCAGQGKSIEVKILDMKTGQEAATVRLTARGKNTEFAAALHGAVPERKYEFLLGGGTFDRPEGSSTVFCEIMANASGDGNAAGILTYHGHGDVKLETIADGNHSMGILPDVEKGIIYAGAVVPKIAP